MQSAVHFPSCLDWQCITREPPSPPPLPHPRSTPLILLRNGLNNHLSSDRGPDDCRTPKQIGNSPPVSNDGQYCQNDADRPINIFTEAEARGQGIDRSCAVRVPSLASCSPPPPPPPPPSLLPLPSLPPSTFSLGTRGGECFT